jgi:hypothetical protein
VYELWFIDSGNIVGVFDTLAELVQAIVGLVKENPDLEAQDLGVFDLQLLLRMDNAET